MSAQDRQTSPELKFSAGLPLQCSGNNVFAAKPAKGATIRARFVAAKPLASSKGLVASEGAPAPAAAAAFVLIDIPASAVVAPEPAGRATQAAKVGNYPRQ